MRTITPGKVRSLTATSSPRGVFRVLAVDHRDSLRIVIDPEHPSAVPAAQLTDVKLNLIRKLGPEATAIMLDPEYSIAQAIGSRVLPGNSGFLAAVEAQGYLGDPTARQTSLLDGWSVEKAKRVGATAIKLLVLYRPDAGAITEAQDRVIEAVVSDCARYDIALFLEPLAYTTENGMSTDSPGFAALRRDIVIDTVKRLGALGPDVLKVQFPVDTRYEPDRGVWADACAELNDAAPVPWALLSGGDPFELFREQVQMACLAGASGFLVGRAIWGDYVSAAPTEQAELMEEVVLPRFRELSALANEYGRDWAERYQLPEADERWFMTY